MLPQRWKNSTSFSPTARGTPPYGSARSAVAHVSAPLPSPIPLPPSPLSHQSQEVVVYSVLRVNRPVQNTTLDCTEPTRVPSPSVSSNRYHHPNQTLTQTLATQKRHGPIRPPWPQGVSHLWPMTKRMTIPFSSSSLLSLSPAVPPPPCQLSNPATAPRFIHFHSWWWASDPEPNR